MNHYTMFDPCSSQWSHDNNQHTHSSNLNEVYKNMHMDRVQICYVSLGLEGMQLSNKLYKRHLQDLVEINYTH